jgi:hypothetical protein
MSSCVCVCTCVSACVCVPVCVCVCLYGAFVQALGTLGSDGGESSGTEGEDGGWDDAVTAAGLTADQVGNRQARFMVHAHWTQMLKNIQQKSLHPIHMHPRHSRPWFWLCLPLPTTMYAFELTCVCARVSIHACVCVYVCVCMSQALPPDGRQWMCAICDSRVDRHVAHCACRAGFHLDCLANHWLIQVRAGRGST